ncbi:MAG: hypothetical protein JWO41_578 [Candidatus Saccharibacteria bacterium]|nr:hypothetical protein [Candidatus Saccharibacteria bacterium]
MQRVIFSGYTPYPLSDKEDRLPHLAQKINNQIRKTALDAEKLVPWERSTSITATITALKATGYAVIALEQTDGSIKLPDYRPPDKVVVFLGREVEGIEPELLALCDSIVEIPMFGKKESFNVVQAAAMALYHCRFAG